MAVGSLLALFDDITSILDDVATMTKVAATKTAGVLGDDLALNAQQLTGVNADRELPVVWAVAKGSFKNKLILVPAALALSYFAHWAITPLLMLGGAYLCFEGFEKIAHQFLHSRYEDASNEKKLIKATHDAQVDMVNFEQEKIKGAIRTDFILSAEIIVIALGTVVTASFTQQVFVVSSIAVVMTIGVYGLVAGIVKLDDAGLFLMKKQGGSIYKQLQRAFGAKLLAVAPILMRILSVVGTAAMFMVGGGIVVHGVYFLKYTIERFAIATGDLSTVGGFLETIIPTLMNILVGIIIGAIVLMLISTTNKVCKILK